MNNNLINRQEWVDHHFNFQIHVGWTSNILSRIRDTHIRLKHYCENQTEEQLEYQPDGKWSIKEHIGHLIDLEELHFNRLVQFDKLENSLGAADMTNTQTEKADHNRKSLKSLIDAFESSRKKFLLEYEKLSDESHNHNAFHPRLKVHMKPVDMIFFMAEHDDHHLTTICEILLVNKL